MNAHPGSSAAVVLGDIEAKKFHSCVTLFAQVAEPASPFHDVLAKYCFGAADQATLAILARQAGSN